MYLRHFELPDCAQAAQCAARLEQIDFDESIWSEYGDLPALSKATPERKREFVAGRHCAAVAMQSLGEHSIVGVRADRSPQWPIGITGSISHGGEVVWAAVASTQVLTSLGIDVERIVDDKTADEVESVVATPQEVKQLAEVVGTRRVAVSLTFSAKEAAYKCVAPLGFRHLDFLDAVVTPNDMVTPCDTQLVCDFPNLNVHDSRELKAITGGGLKILYEIRDDHVYTFCSVSNHSSRASHSLVA